MFNPHLINFIDHLVFRVSNLSKTESFYTVLLGQTPEYAEDSLSYVMGNTRLFFTPAAKRETELYDKENIGLNHIAFGVRTVPELQAIQKQLDTAGIVHSGIALDPYGLKEFLWLDDPDGLRVEFYLRPE